MMAQEVSEGSGTLTGMCAICKGWTYEEVAADQRHRITTIGWTVQVVEPRPGRIGWSSTIGLSESCRHPELLVFGRDVRSDGLMLDLLAANVRDGMIVEPGCEAVGEVDLEVLEVHPVHLFGELVTAWQTVYEDRVARDRPELRVLQLRDPSADDHDRDLRIRLDRPYARLPRP